MFVTSACVVQLIRTVIDCAALPPIIVLGTGSGAHESFHVKGHATTATPYTTAKRLAAMGYIVILVNEFNTSKVSVGVVCIDSLSHTHTLCLVRSVQHVTLSWYIRSVDRNANIATKLTMLLIISDATDATAISSLHWRFCDASSHRSLLASVRWHSVLVLLLLLLLLLILLLLLLLLILLLLPPLGALDLISYRYVHCIRVTLTECV